MLSGSYDKVAIDFVIALLDSKSYKGVVYNSILTVTCRLIKRKHYILVINLEPETIAKVVLYYIIKDIDIFYYIISNRGI